MCYCAVMGEHDGYHQTHEVISLSRKKSFMIQMFIGDIMHLPSTKLSVLLPPDLYITNEFTVTLYTRPNVKAEPWINSQKFLDNREPESFVYWQALFRIVSSKLCGSQACLTQLVVPNRRTFMVSMCVPFHSCARPWRRRNPMRLSSSRHGFTDLGNFTCVLLMTS